MYLTLCERIPKKKEIIIFWRITCGLKNENEQALSGGKMYVINLEYKNVATLR